MRDEAITPREKDYSKWYLDVIAAADLAENSPARGCMVIKPYGYALWENMQKELDRMFKETGVENAYFPLFIPKSFLEREAEHVEGFAKECAVITHHRLESDGKGGLKPAGELEEPYIVRPTSETIMYDTYARWIQSYRDLPLLINQWANVVRWEMRTRLFLRTAEFLWQEGHTAHVSAQEAEDRTFQMLEVYRTFAEEFMAMPVLTGKKSESEKFPGADYTTCIEAMMQDTKALQAGTSHNLGQNFAKGFGIKFQSEEGQEEYAHQTSWGVSTRLIGGLIMTHSDDKGLVLPPRLAPIQVVIVPIWKNEAGLDKKIEQKVENLAQELKEAGHRVKVDGRDLRPGPRFFEWEKKGVPIRIELGAKDLEKGTVVAVRRDTSDKDFIDEKQLGKWVAKTLEEIQKNLLSRAQEFRTANSHTLDTWDEFTSTIESKGGFIHAHWCGDAKCEESIQTDTKATIRCLPFDAKKKKGKCVKCGKDSEMRVVFAKAY